MSVVRTYPAVFFLDSSKTAISGSQITAYSAIFAHEPLIGKLKSGNERISNTSCNKTGINVRFFRQYQLIHRQSVMCTMMDYIKGPHQK